MLGIDPNVICHKLHREQNFKAIFKKKRNHGPEWGKIIETEIEKLKNAGFIMEFFHLEWLSNVVLVKKKNGNSEYVWTSQIGTGIVQRIAFLCLELTNSWTPHRSTRGLILWMPIMATIRYAWTIPIWRKLPL